jgi:hypothetical protein
MRRFASVISGYALWTVVWLAGNALLKNGGVLPANDTRPIRDVGPLLIVLGLGVACSLLAGFLASSISRTSVCTSLAILGVLLLATGCYFEVSSWNLTPVWYHVAFLAMLIPATFVGGRLIRRPGPGAGGNGA